MVRERFSRTAKVDATVTLCAQHLHTAGRPLFIKHALVYGEARTHEHTVVTCTGASETTRLGGVAVGVTNRVRERLRRTTEIHTKSVTSRDVV